MNFLFTCLIITSALFWFANATVQNSSELLRFAAILPEECGENSSDRIIGGTEANLGQYPWIARIGYQLENCSDTDKYLCAGSLVTERHIVTAAHCITDMTDLPCDSQLWKMRMSKLNSILLGEYNENTDIDCVDDYCAPAPQYFKIIGAVHHSQYNTPDSRNDIAVMKMDKAAKFNEFVFPICLPLDLEAPKVGTRVEIAGWGIKNIRTMEHATTLQYLDIPIVPNEQCSKAFEFDGIEVDDSQICSGGLANKDSCVGDSGGPLMMISSHQGSAKQFLSGVVSFGKSICGTEGSPAIYTNVNNFVPWILNEIQVQ